MQRTEKYLNRTLSAPSARAPSLPQSRMKRPAAGALRWTAQCFTRRAAVSLLTGAP